MEMNNKKLSLRNEGFDELASSDASSKFLTLGVNREIDIEEYKDDLLPKEISSAISFLINGKDSVPTDERILFFLKSLLILDKASKELIFEVSDKLSEYASYYDPDPYSESLHRIYTTGKNEYLKLFTEERFRDMQLVLEFSKIARIHNSGCKRDFADILESLKMIVNVAFGEENQTLLNKFKILYRKMIRDFGVETLSAEHSFKLLWEYQGDIGRNIEVFTFDVDRLIRTTKHLIGSKHILDISKVGKQLPEDFKQSRKSRAFKFLRELYCLNNNELDMLWEICTLSEMQILCFGQHKALIINNK
ncbi:hypothetical protein BCR32DRAFT_306550 [Anaeromyces robustus]|uniref:Uncharacterized protein n=1 Tax=Anaeromyces robustus TaxID=1754192 RepID=A0A1Y1XFQ2_9FUNG|nr:hypothetical protein BCR32DRAFT_306550 [Anaeromyces robustus]|eukprot:ORX84547.1 hypothetical protein BCR32DRAFT_306550 [Anaeromyces robustus]